MNRLPLRTLPPFLASLVLTMMMTPSMTHNETSTKPPFDAVNTLNPLITEIHESKRSILLMASLPTRILVIVSAPASTTLTEALVFEQTPETLRHNLGAIKEFYLTMHLETEPQPFTEKWPKLAHLTAGATCVALRDAYQSGGGNTSGTHQSANEYLLIGDAGRLTFLQLDTGEVTQRALPDASTYDRLFKYAILLSTFTETEPMTFTRLIPHGSTHLIVLQKVTFRSAEGRLPSFETVSRTEGPDTYLCLDGLVSSDSSCGTPTNWSVTYGFRSGNTVYLSETLSSSFIEIVNFTGDAAFTGNKEVHTVPLANFWSHKYVREESHNYGLYSALVLLVLAGVAFVAYDKGCKGKSGKKSSSGKVKNGGSSGRAKGSSGAVSKGSSGADLKSKGSKTGSRTGSKIRSSQSKKGSSTAQSTQA